MKKPVSYLQTDPRWAKNSYSAKGESTTIGASGCGPTAMAMVLATWANKDITPATECKWAQLSGYKIKDVGTSHGYFTPAAARYGLTCKVIEGATHYHKPSAPQHKKALDAIAAGTNLVIASMGPGTWTKGGHFVLVYDIDVANNIVYINDPASTAANRTKGNYKTFCNEVKLYWIINGPAGTIGGSASSGSGGFLGLAISQAVNAVGQAIDLSAKGFTAYDDGTKASFIKNARTNKIGKVAELKSKIGAVDKYIGSKHDVTAFLTFSVNNFSLDTRDKDSFKHYAISMENVKTGVGQGNQFKITIAYHKHFSAYQDIHALEQALGPLKEGSLMSYTSSNMSSTREKLTKNTCTLQYGYNTNDSTLISPKYTGLLLKYSVTANKQIVEYTLEGFTGEQISVNTVNWYPNVVGMDSVVTPNGKVARAVMDLKDSKEKLSSDKAQAMIKELNTQYSGGITFQPYLALDCFLQDYNASVSQSGGTKYYLIDCTSQTKGKLSANDTLEPVHMSICRGQTPLQYIEYCIGLFKYKTTANYAIQYLQQNQEVSERFVYSFVRDPEDSTKMYVCVDVIDSTDSDSRVAYEFTGYTPNNNLLIDYNLNYDGTVALSLADALDENITDNAIYVDKDGTLRAKQSLTRDMFVSGEIDEVLITKQNTWIDKVSVANNCTMTTFGLPFEISVGTVFKCGIYITDTLHHSSGNCFVTGITDRIDGNMFTTSFNLIRLPGKNSKIN